MFSFPKGILSSTPETITTSLELVRLWVHESSRVYGDRLNEDKDVDLFRKMLNETVKKCFDRQSASDNDLESSSSALADVDEASILLGPIIFCHFAKGLGDAKYSEVTDYSSLVTSLRQALATYNEFNPAMDLVLFENAISHICRYLRYMSSIAYVCIIIIDV